MNNNADGQGSVAYDAPNSAVQLVGVSGGSFSRSVGATPTAGFQSSPPPPPTPVYTFPPAPPGPGLDIAPTSESSSMVKGRSVRGYFKSHVNVRGPSAHAPSLRSLLSVAIGAERPNGSCHTGCEFMPPGSPDVPSEANCMYLLAPRSRSPSASRRLSSRRST